jgi:hypothetical protein
MRVTANKSFTTALVMLVASSFASSLMANQAPDKDKQTKGKPQQPSVVQIPKELALDAQQKEAIAALNAEYLPKLAELKQQQEGILTTEQKQALADVKNAAKDSGKDKAELARLLRDAVQFTDAQVQQQAGLKRKMIELNQEIQDRFMKLLTAEQREILKQSKGEVKKDSGKPTGEKKPAAEKPSSKKPTAEKPAETKPSGEKPADKKPTSEKPAAKNLSGEKSVAKKPTTKKPTDKKPTSEQPAAKKLSGEKPVAKKPAEKKPSGEKPMDKKPTSEKPVAEKPSGEQPVDKKPSGEKPAQKGAPEKKPSGKESDEKKPDAQAPAKKVEKESKDQPEKKPTDKK